MKKELILIIIFGLITFAIGGGLGVVSQMQTYQPKISQTDAIIKILSSKLVSPVTAFGTVKAISPGRNLTLNYAGDTIVVKVSPIAGVFSAVSGGTAKNVGFSAIKVGDYVNLSLSTYKDYVIEADRVLIISSATP